MRLARSSATRRSSSAAAGAVPGSLVGWLWYLGTLVPVIGLVQVGAAGDGGPLHLRAAVGLSIALAWLGPPGAAGAARGCRGGRRCWRCAAQTRAQIGVWRDSTTLFAHALAVDERNAIAHVNLGVELGARGDAVRATTHLERALELRPDLVTARIALGDTLMQPRAGGRRDHPVPRRRRRDPGVGPRAQQPRVRPAPAGAGSTMRSRASRPD